MIIQNIFSFWVRKQMSRNSRYLLWTLIILGSLSINFSIPLILEKHHHETPFVVGKYINPPRIDPLFGYDSESQDLIMQVCEGLYRYNFSSTENEPIPCLAKSMASRSGNNFTFSLHENVTFHDGTKFNASAVKWTFDRIQYFTSGLFTENGDLIGKSILTPSSYDLFFIDDVPILNSTVIESEYVVTLVINYGCGLWENLLANSLTTIHLPDGNYQMSYKFNNYIDLDDQLIGTGPFKLIKYDYDSEIVFEYFEDYRLPKPENNIKKMIYLLVADSHTRSQGIVDYEIHWGHIMACYCHEFNYDPNIVDVVVSAPVVFYIQMNMENMPFEVRRASAFAYNYTYLIEERHRNWSLYLHTPIPDGMQYHLKNYTGEPYTNLTYARQLILSCPELTANISLSGLSIDNTTEQWRNVAMGSNPIAWYNFTGYSGLETHYEQLSDYMKVIGIRIDMVPLMPWYDYLDNYLDTKEGNKKLTYSFGGWGPNYNDPMNMIEPLYHSNGSANCFLLSDTTLDDLIADAYNETGSDRRNAVDSIQEYLATDLMPSFYIYQRLSSISFNKLYVNESTVQDMKNAFGFEYWANVEFHPPLDAYQKYGIHWIIGLISFSTIMTILGISFIIRDIVRDRKLNLSAQKSLQQYFCPECGNVFKGPNYCRFCGYKIDKSRLEGERNA